MVYRVVAPGVHHAISASHLQTSKSRRRAAGARVAAAQNWSPSPSRACGGGGAAVSRRASHRYANAAGRCFGAAQDG
ncbi:MAG: hypothetical protein EOO40_01250 [Deltaproteobacteria bacterium]|nr:MAG: hypothetical protein EOO40_01250 [Deltaproteobacteria bacterium]